MSMTMNRKESDPVRLRSATALVVPGVLTLTVPLLGFVASLSLPFLAARSRSRLWPRTSPLEGHLAAALAVTGLWMPALLALTSQGRLGSDANAWLLLPLCAPVGAALVVPTVLAVATYLVGTALGVLRRNPWPWAVGAWAAPLVYAAAGHWLVDFACVA